MIDFSATHSDSKGLVHFCKESDEVVKSYGMDQVIEYARKNFLKEWIAEFEESGKEFNPMKNKYQEKYFGKFEQYVLDTYLDDYLKWIEVTKAFYLSLNKSEFKSNNIPKPI